MHTVAKLSLALVFALFLSTSARAAETIEKFDDGLIKVKYTTSAAGQKIGPYLENYPKGKVKLRCSYKADKLDGDWTSFYESGTVHTKTIYADGRINGPYLENDETGKVLKDQIFWQGTLLYPRSKKMLAAALADLTKPVPAPGPAKPASNQPAAKNDLCLTDPANLEALRRLNTYRLLAGLPADVTLNTDYCHKMQAGVQLLQKVGRLEISPPNPGLPDAEYQFALDGTTHSAQHHGNTRSSIEFYMNDSDPGSIAILGRRRSCLNPAMLQTGFGEAGNFTAIYLDQSRKDLPDYDFFSFPGRGFMPSSFFGSDWAWLVSVNPHLYQPPAAGLKVAVYPLLSREALPDPAKRGPALELNSFHVDSHHIGVDNAIIFRPKAISLQGPQTRYWVEITGLKKTDGSDAKIEYLVDFCSL